MLKKLTAMIIMVMCMIVNIASASDLIIMSIPDCYAGEMLYIGGRYPTGEVTVKVYKPGEEEVFDEATVTTGPDHSFSYACKTDADSEGEYRIEVLTRTESASATANVRKKKQKPPVVNGINVMVDGEYVAFDQPPIIINDRTMVPVRAIFEKLNAKVTWDENTREVTAIKGDRIIVMGIDSINAKVSGEDVILDQPATIVNERTLIPLRFAGTALGATVEWDGVAKLVTINTK